MLGTLPFLCSGQSCATSTLGFQTGDDSTFDLLAQDADNPSFARNFGNFDLGAGNETTADFTTAVFNVTSNGSDDVLLRLDPTSIANAGALSDWVGINGLKIQATPMSDPIPEPTSQALLATRLGVLGLRRRVA